MPAHDLLERQRHDLVVELVHPVLVTGVVAQNGVAGRNGDLVRAGFDGLIDKAAKGCRYPLGCGVDEGVAGRGGFSSAKFSSN